MKNILITICGRAGSKGFKNKNLKMFCGYPLVYYTLSAAELFANQTDDRVDVCLNTDSDLLANLVAEKYPEVTYLPRGEELGGDSVPKMAVFQDSLRRMEEKNGIRYDYLIDLDITSPLRRIKDLSGAYEMKKERNDLDLVFSVTDSRRNPYFNMAKDCGDHVEQVLKSNFTARQQAPKIYDVNASLYVFDRDYLVSDKSSFIWNSRIGVVVMKDTAVLDIDSEEDYELLSLIAGYLYENDPEFAEIRDNIRK